MKLSIKSIQIMPVYLAVVIVCSTSCTLKLSESVDQSEVGKGLSDEALLTEADKFYEMKNFEEAKKYYDVLISQRGVSNGEVYYKRGYSNALLLNLTESTNDYLKAAELEYRPADSYFNAGINQKLNYNDSLAVIFFQKALMINSKDTAASNELQKALERMQTFDKILKN